MPVVVLRSLFPAADLLEGEEVRTEEAATVVAKEAAEEVVTEEVKKVVVQSLWSGPLSGAS